MSNDGKTRVFARSVARKLSTEELDQVSGGYPSGILCDQAGEPSYRESYTGVDPSTGYEGNLDDSYAVDSDFEGHW